MKLSNDHLFRKISLERISSPEQLDSLVRVIPGKAWIALSALMGLILLAIIWSWFGSIPTKVLGRCILINPTGLSDIKSNSKGRITKLFVKMGDIIEQNQEIAHIAQPQLMDQITKTEARFKELIAESKVINKFVKRGENLAQQLKVQKEIAIHSELEAALRNAKIALKRVKTQKGLLKKGLVTENTYLGSVEDVVTANLKAERFRNDLKQLSLQLLDSEKKNKNELSIIESQVNEMEIALENLYKSRDRASIIFSPYSGRIVEIKTEVGALVGVANSLMTIERLTAQKKELQVIIFASVRDGKKIKKGMQAQILPTTVKREEHGFMFGVVDYVSDYPVSRASIQRRLQNERLVQELSGDSPPTEIHAKLLLSDDQQNFKWSSSANTPLPVSSGTLCSADIVVNRQRPISLVIPVFKKSLGIY